jgi:hypothetical protein
MVHLNIKKTKAIKNKATAIAFDTNNHASALFYIMANVGGMVGLLTRNFSSIYEIEQVSQENSFNFLNFLPKETQEELMVIAKNHLVISTFITNSSHKYDRGDWHVVCCSYQKIRIKTILSHVNSEYLKKGTRKTDELTTFHFK